MALRIPKNEYSIDKNMRATIALRCATVTKAINNEFWNGSTNLSHSFYVGSYGRYNGEFIKVMKRLNKIYVEMPTTTNEAVYNANKALKEKKYIMDYTQIAPWVG